MRRPGKLGLGTAYRDGFRWGLQRDYEYLMEMDADFSHDPSHIPAFLQAAQEADFVIGSRYLEGNVTVTDWPMSRLLLSYFANVYARTVTGLRIWDLTAGFKCFRRRVLAAIDLNDVRSNGYGFQIEMNFRAHRKGFKWKEIGIVFSDRTHGTSKMHGGIVREAVMMVWRLRFWALTGRI
jgi:dolichol-phosphate mannosyltransferase